MDVNGLSPEHRSELLRQLLGAGSTPPRPAAPATVPQGPPVGVRQLRAFWVDIGSEDALQRDVGELNDWLRGRPAGSLAQPIIVQADGALTVLFFFDEARAPGGAGE